MFFVAALTVILSSYLVLSLISAKTKQFYGFIYFVLIAFSQIIFSVELLSIFKAITKNNFIILNLAFLLVAIFVFIKSKSKFYVPDIKDELRKIKTALKRDKLLFVCCIGYAVFLIFDLINIFFGSITFGDALSYYFPRGIHQIMNGTLNHFVTPDARAIVMPFNFDILYMLHFLFLKTEKGIAIYSFCGYLFGVNVLYLFVRELFASARRALWSVFVFSAFALVVSECISPVHDISLGGLLLCVLFLFLSGIKNNNKIALYFSTLALALALGVKTTAIMCMPALFIAFLYFRSFYKSSFTKKNIMFFSVLFIINFLLFSSYNYILNFIDFNNPVFNSEHMYIHSFKGGFPGFFCNLTKYCFMIFDTSGVNTGYFGGFIMNLQSLFLGIFGLTDTSYTSERFLGYFDFNSYMSINSAALGALGIVAFLPSLIKSLKRKKKNLVTVFVMCLAINITILSFSMIFAPFNNRYILTFVVLSSPLLLYSYTKKTTFCKILTVLLVLWYFYFNINFFFKTSDINLSEEQTIYENLKNISGKNIGLTLNNTQTQVFYLVKPVLNGNKVYYIIPEILDTYDLTKYDYIISDKRDISSDYVVGNHKNVKPNYKCDYVDADGNFTLPGNENMPVGVVCDSPVYYYIENGFNPVFETQNFLILNKK